MITSKWQQQLIEIKAKKKLGSFLLDAELRDEGFICLIGRNGSGKSTLLELTAGIRKLEVDEGYVKINSKEVTNIPQEKKEIVLVAQDSHIPNLDVEKHLLFGARVKKLEINEDTVEDVKNKLGINYSGKVSKLSLGMKERVALATAFISNPRLILIDEAFSNLDNKSEFIPIFKGLTQKSKIDVIFTTQHQDDSEAADHIYRIDGGRTNREY